MGHRVTFLTPFSGPFTEVPGVEFRYPSGPEPGESGPSYPETYFAGELAHGSSAQAIEGWDAWVASRTASTTPPSSTFTIGSVRSAAWPSAAGWGAPWC